MSVESVNNSNNNAGLYAAGAATIGAGAGAAAGWYSKPFLKDGAPTDSFIKSMNENIKKEMPKEMREFVEDFEGLGKELQKALDNAKSIEELKSSFVNGVFKDIPDNIAEEGLNILKESISASAETFEQLGVNTEHPEVFEKVKNAESVQELKTVYGEILDKCFDGKTIEEIKNEANKESQKVARQLGKGIFEEYWDSSKKEFVNCEEGVGKAIKKAARGIQTKYAAIYGGIAAAVLGIGTYLLTNNNKPEEQPEKVDTQA